MAPAGYCLSLRVELKPRTTDRALGNLPATQEAVHAVDAMTTKTPAEAGL